MAASRSKAVVVVIVAILAMAPGLAACGGGDGGGSAATEGATTSNRPEPAVTVRLGYFPTVTHAPALVGVQEGLFEDALAPHKLTTRTFNAGPEAVQAVFSGALDAAYLGPNPAINAYAKSKGAAIRIVAGATSGGAAFVVAPSISTAAGLKGKTVASPQLGNTQDVALRAWLKTQGLATTTSGGGDVKIVPQANADILTAFKAKRIAGAWVAEPWATRLVQEAGGKVLVDETDLWPGGRFVTAHLVVRTDFAKHHPGALRALLQGHVDAVERAASGDASAKSAKAAANDRLASLTGKPLSQDVLDASWANLTFTADPIASSLRTSAQHAQGLGLLEAVDLGGIYDLGPLNSVLQAAGKEEVKE